MATLTCLSPCAASGAPSSVARDEALHELRGIAYFYLGRSSVPAVPGYFQGPAEQRRDVGKRALAEAGRAGDLASFISLAAQVLALPAVVRELAAVVRHNDADDVEEEAGQARALGCRAHACAVPCAVATPFGACHAVTDRIDADRNDPQGRRVRRQVPLATPSKWARVWDGHERVQVGCR